MRRQRYLSPVLHVDCSELTVDEQLALASEISDSLDGRAIALVKRDLIVLDVLTDEKIGPETILPVVRDFISRRKNGEIYSVETDSDGIVVHSADPVAAGRSREERGLPPSLKQCSMCSFITQYDEELTVHIRSHYFGV